LFHGWTIALAAAAYLGVLFAVAYYGDRRADAGRSIIANPSIYSLSLAVYASSWTFYGSVGRAASSGIGFLPIYLGPTLMAALWWLILRKMIRISKVYRITSIADFISSRYGKSPPLAGLVTIIAVVGIVPYISLQLKAISNSFTILVHYPDVAGQTHVHMGSFWRDTGFYVALLLAAFTIVFGTRKLDASERHEGMVAAIAFESLVKLLAFLSVGVFATFVMFGGFGDVFGQAAALPAVEPLLVFGEATGTFGSWAWLIFLSMLAIMLLPRQFQVSVVENVSESHVKKATWLFPLYLLAINIFVLPVAFAGLLRFGTGGVEPDYFVLALPMAEGHPWLALFVFIGGLSAATGMVIVETIALSTMVCNDLVMPVLLRTDSFALNRRADLGRLLLAIRRGAILMILLLGYAYFVFAGEAYALVSIGLISFAAVAQFAPALLGGIFWKGGTRRGALAGLSAGFVIWIYTLLLPSFARSGWLPAGLLEEGPFGIGLLKPEALFGLEGLDQITHALLWSMLANVGLYVGLSLGGHRTAVEHSQAALFVDVFRRTGGGRDEPFWRGTAKVQDLYALVARFLGPARADVEFTALALARGVHSPADLQADAELVHFVERLLTGVIGSASARITVASVTKEEQLDIEEVMLVLDEASEAIAYSHELEEKSRELEAATAELRAANEQLKQLDRMKDDFVSTVSHELRTPLTSIRSFSEILFENPDLELEQRARYLGIIVKESERLTRLINQVLDLARLEAGAVQWRIADLHLADAVDDAVTATGRLFADKRVLLRRSVPAELPAVRADHDRVVQVLINLLANAVKFSPPEEGRVEVVVRAGDGHVEVAVSDNGPGIRLEDQPVIFEKFRQAGDTLTEKPTGTGLGLPISRHIIAHLGGRLWVQSEPGRGSVFFFTLPVAAADGGGRPEEAGSAPAGVRTGT